MIDIEGYRAMFAVYRATTGADRSFRAHQLAAAVPGLLDEVERLRAVPTAVDPDGYCDYGYPLGGQHPRIEWCGLWRGHSGVHVGGRGGPGFTSADTVRRGDQS